MTKANIKTDNELNTTYFYFDINCECCEGNKHVVVVKHNKDEIPEVPKKIKVNVRSMFGGYVETTILYPTLIKQETI